MLEWLTNPQGFDLALWIAAEHPVLQSVCLPLQRPGDHDAPVHGAIGPGFAHGPDSSVLPKKRVIASVTPCAVARASLRPIGADAMIEPYVCGLVGCVL